MFVCVYSVLALLINVPGIRVSIFSTGKRASGSLLQIVLDFLQKVPGGRDRILKTNQGICHNHCMFYFVKINIYMLLFFINRRAFSSCRWFW